MMDGIVSVNCHIFPVIGAGVPMRGDIHEVKGDNLVVNRDILKVRCGILLVICGILMVKRDIPVERYGILAVNRGILPVNSTFPGGKHYGRATNAAGPAVNCPNQLSLRST